MRRYTQLAREQRYQIQALLKAGHNQSEIVMILGCQRSTISRDPRRNCGLRGKRYDVYRRPRIGDWELDTIIGRGQKQALVSLSERKSRLTLLAKLPNRETQTLNKAIRALLEPLSHRVHTLTSDNGKEFAEPETIANAVGAQFYFAHPYTSWERGLNENTNGVIRQYFPKDSDFNPITEAEIDTAMSKLNNRPRKCLGMKTPNQVFCGINPPVALAS